MATDKDKQNVAKEKAAKDKAEKEATNVKFSQYHFPGLKPEVKTSRGYGVDLGRDPKRSTATLRSPDGVEFPLLVTDITFNFSIGGSNAQAHRFRAWYPRNFAQPTVTLSGQSPDQKYYGELAEFVRRTQTAALAYGTPRADVNTTATKLSIPQGGKHRLQHQTHVLYGHIRSIQRRTVRFEFFPDWSFEFVLVAAENGFLHDLDMDKKAAEMMRYVDPTATQMANTKKRKVTKTTDPDSRLPASSFAGLATGTGPTASARTASTTTSGNAQANSPVPGMPPQRLDHNTDGLPGFPAADYMTAAGTTVVAPVSGKVYKLSGHDPSQGGAPGGPMGYSIYIQGDDGKKYFLTHLDNVTVNVGQKVSQGTKIAVVANGPPSWSEPHVHMGVSG